MILVLVFCLGFSDDCREERPIVDAAELVLPIGCIMAGQRYGEAWLEEHPKWRLAGWRCELPPGRPQRRA